MDIFTSLHEWLEQVYMLLFILFLLILFSMVMATSSIGFVFCCFLVRRLFFYNIHIQEACLAFGGLKEMWYPLLLFMFNFCSDWKWVIEELTTSFQ